jgi:ribonucleoside-diphosphate reductase alpha chain
VFRRLSLDYLPTDVREGLGIRSIQERKEAVAEEKAEAGPGYDAAPAMPQRIEPTERRTARELDAPLCYQCGSKMQPSGSCYVCGTCGSTSGCS